MGRRPRSRAAPPSRQHVHVGCVPTSSSKPAVGGALIEIPPRPPRCVRRAVAGHTAAAHHGAPAAPPPRRRGCGSPHATRRGANGRRRHPGRAPPPRPRRTPRHRPRRTHLRRPRRPPCSPAARAASPPRCAAAGGRAARRGAVRARPRLGAALPQAGALGERAPRCVAPTPRSRASAAAPRRPRARRAGRPATRSPPAPTRAASGKGVPTQVSGGRAGGAVAAAARRAARRGSNGGARPDHGRRLSAGRPPRGSAAPLPRRSAHLRTNRALRNTHALSLADYQHRTH